MYHKRKRGTWYGMLESRKGDTVVVWDSVLPRASTGKVFLYSTLKEELVEYVEEIVQSKLRELTASELREAREKYEAGWNRVRSRFVKVVESESDNAGTGKEVAINNEISSIGDDSLEIDDAFDDL